jgi:hypothetical protein
MTVDDKHVLIKAAFIEEVKDLLQDEVSATTSVSEGDAGGRSDWNRPC